MLKPNHPYRIATVNLCIPNTATACDVMGECFNLFNEPEAKSWIHAFRLHPKLPLIKTSDTPGISEPFQTFDALRALADAAPEKGSLAQRFNVRQISAEHAIKELARSFPTLTNDPHFSTSRPWDACVLSNTFDGCSGACHAVRFILKVWNPTTVWNLGRFDIMDALPNWDRAHRYAFLAWVANPWWP